MKGAAASLDPGRSQTPTTRVRPSPLAAPVAGPMRDDMPAPSAATSIVDADLARAELTKLLLSALAPRLGLRVEDVRIRVDGHADSLAGARGARGLMAGGTVHLRPGSYDPRSVAGRRLLGHEVTHVAQRAERHLRPDAPRPDAASAEMEADRIGRLFAETGMAELPRAILPAGALAADSGAASIVRAQVVPAEGVPEETQVELDLLTLLGDQVRLLHKREVSRFGNILNARYLSGSLVEEACAILQAVEFPVAAAVASTVPLERRARLLGAIGTNHRRRHQRGVLAYYTTLGRREFETETGDLLDGFDLYRLTLVERTALVRAMRLMTEASLRASLGSKHRKQVQALILEPLPPGQTVEEQAKLAADQLESRVEESRALAEDHRIAEVLRELHRLLRKPSAADAGRALDIIAGYSAPAPQAKDDAVQNGDQAGPSPAQAFLVAELDLTGAIDRLIDALPAEERLKQGGRRDAFLQMLRARRADLNIALAVDLLSYKLFDLAVRDWEALLAYDVVKQMAPADQYRFRHLDGGKWYARLIGNLPDAFVRADDFEGVEIAPDETGQFKDVAGEHRRILTLPDNRKIVEQVMELGRRGFDAKTAIVAYDILTRIRAGRIDPRTDEENLHAATQDGLLEALVRRMDTFGYLADLFDELPESVLFDTDRLPDTQRIMRARDPVVLGREARDLLGDESLLAVVTARDAWLAYQLIHGLPPSDRTALEAYKGGELWSKMAGEMTASMQESLSFSFHTGGAEQRDAVRMQLRDAKLWERPENVGRLRTLIRMAVALGDRRWVFEQSRIHAAHRKSWLERLGHDYRLYDPGQGRDEYRAELVEGTSWYEEGPLTYLPMVPKGIALLAGSNLFLSKEAVGAESLDLTEVQSLLGGTFGVARLEDRDGEPNAERRGAAGGRNLPNRLDLRWDMSRGLLELKTAELRLAAISHVGAALTLKAGRSRLSRLAAQVGYPTSEFDHPAFVQASLEELVLEDVLVIMAGRVIGIERITIQPITVRMGMTGEERIEGIPSADSPLIPVPLLAPLLGSVCNIASFLWSPKPSARESDLQQGIASMRSTELSIGRLLVEGVSTTDGQNVASMEARDIDIAVAGNRPTYLRALIASLSRRILERHRSEAETDREAEVARLQDQKRAAENELAILRPLENLYLLLQRKRRFNPNEFSPQDLINLRQVEEVLLRPASSAGLPPGALPPESKTGGGTPPQTGRGGAVFDIGSFKVSGLSGRVEMDDIEIDGIHGEGQSAMLAMEALTDGDLILRMIREGPPKPDQLRGTDASEIVLEIGRLRASGVLVRTIPTLQQFWEHVRSLPDTEEGRKRREALFEVQDLLEEYHMLTDRAKLLPGIPVALSAADQERLVALHGWLSARFGTRVGSVDLDGTALTANLTSGRYGIRTANVDIRNVEREGLSIDAIVGRNVSGGIGLKGGMAGFGQADEHFALDAEADRLDFEGVTLGQGGGKIGRIGLGGLKLEIRRTAEGYALDRFVLDEIAVEGLDFHAGGARVWSTGKSVLSGIEVAARLTISKGTEPMAGRIKGAVIDSLFIRRAEADRLGFEHPADGMRIEVERGALGDIWASGVNLDMSAGGDFSVTGSAGIDSFDALKFSAALGEKFASGTVSSAARGDGIPGSGDGAIRVNLASTGSQTVAINHLVLTDGDFRTEDGRIRVTRLDMSAEVERTPEKITAKSFEIHELSVLAIDWRAGGARLTADGPATLKGLSLRAGVDLAGGKAGAARIEWLRVRRIAAAGLRYVDPPIDVHVRPQEPGDPQPPLEITGIELKDVQWSKGGGVTSGGLSVDTVHTEFAAQLASRRNLHGRLDANRISATFSKGGRIVARAQDVAADLLVSDVSEGRVVRTGISISGFDTGEIGYDKTGLTIGAGDSPGLRLKELSLDGLHVSSPSFGIHTTRKGNKVRLLGLDLKLDVEFSDEKDRKPDQPLVRRIRIRQMHIDEIQARGLVVSLPDQHLTITLPERVPSRILGIDLTPVSGDDAFTIESAVKPVPSPEADKPAGQVQAGTAPRTTTVWEMQGQLGIKGVQVTGLDVLLARRLNLVTDFSTDGIQVHFLKANELIDTESSFLVDIRNPSLSNIEAQIYGPDNTVKGNFLLRQGKGGTKKDVIPGIGAERIWYGKGGVFQDGWFEVEGASVRGFVYEDAKKDIRIDVKEAKAPLKIEQRLGDAEAPGHYFVSELIVTDADFRIGNLTELLDGGEKKEGSSGNFDIQKFMNDLRGSLLNYEDAFNSLTGPLSVDLTYGDYGPFRIRFDFRNGLVNYATFEDTLFSHSGLTDALDMAVDFELDESNRRLVLEADLTDILGGLIAGGVIVFPVVPVVGGGSVVAGLGGGVASEVYAGGVKTPLITWDLAGNFELAENEELVSFFELLTGPQFSPLLAGVINDAVNAPPDPTAVPLKHQLKLTSILANLHMVNREPIMLPLGDVPVGVGTDPGVKAPGRLGSLTLAPGALTRLHVEGDVQASRVNPFSAVKLSLDELDLQALDIRFPTDMPEGHGPSLEASDFHILGIEETTIGFKDLKPNSIKGTIQQASVRDVLIYPNGKKKAP